LSTADGDAERQVKHEPAFVELRMSDDVDRFPHPEPTLDDRLVEVRVIVDQILYWDSIEAKRIFIHFRVTVQR
jgi:hypothetical protein